MSERLTNILGYLTLFAILGAIWVMFGEDPTREQGARGERTFDGLEARINEVATVDIRHGADTVTITRDGDVWRLKQRGGYVVEADKVRAFLRGVALSTRREPKTANKSRYERLGLGSDAFKIALKDDTDGLLLEFDMGKRKDTPDGRSLTYVSQDRDTRSWLVTDLAEVQVQAGWWLLKPALEISEKRFSDVTIGGAWLTRKLSDNNFTLQGLGSSQTAASYWVLGDPARVLSRLDFEDVRKLSNPLVEAKASVDFTTYDGLSLKVSLFDMDGGTWAQLTAEHDVELQAQGEAGTLPDAPADGAAEAAEIMASVRGWVFKLSDMDADILLRQRADFLDSTSAEDAN